MGVDLLEGGALYFWKRLRIAVKLPTLVVGCALFLGIVLGFVGYWTAANNARLYIEQRHQGIIASKASELKNHLENIAQDVRVLAGMPYIADALMDFTSAWNRIEQDQEKILKKLYIEDNIYPEGYREQMDTGESDINYNFIHHGYHKWFRLRPH